MDTHIHIVMFSFSFFAGVNKTGYYNRKKFHSIKLQAIVDIDGNFRDVFVGWPGRSHDARCYANSPINESIESGQTEMFGCEIVRLGGFG